MGPEEAQRSPAPGWSQWAGTAGAWSLPGGGVPFLLGTYVQQSCCGPSIVQGRDVRQKTTEQLAVPKGRWWPRSKGRGPEAVQPHRTNPAAFLPPATPVWAFALPQAFASQHPGICPEQQEETVEARLLRRMSQEVTEEEEADGDYGGEQCQRTRWERPSVRFGAGACDACPLPHAP